MSIDFTKVRWGDRQQLNGAVGQTLQSSELFRVIAPFPCAWRIIAFVECADLTVSANLNVFVGIGSVMKQYRFTAPLQTSITFEIPGQSISGNFETGAFAVATPILFDASIAPLTPWQGLEVQVKR